MDSILEKDSYGKTLFDTDIFRKSEDHNNDKLKLAIENVDPKVLVDSYGRTFLHHAVTAGNSNLVEYLIARGFAVDALDVYKYTPLAFAIDRSDQRMMKILLAAGADVLICNNWGRSVLEIGLTRHHTMKQLGVAEILMEELKKRYSNNAREMARILLDIEYPFPRAMLLKNTAVTKCMLIKGCSVIDEDYRNETALHYAVQAMDFDNVKLLLQFGSRVNAKNKYSYTPIHRYDFGKDENYQILRLLLSYGASLTETNDDGFSMISKTFPKEKAERVKMLLDYEVNLSELLFDCTPLHYLARNKHVGVMELIEDRAFEVDVRDSDGRTPLFVAAEHANAVFVEFLLERGADPRVLNNTGEMVLFHSLEIQSQGPRKYNTRDYVKCVHLLLQYGADVQFVSPQQTTLFEKVENLAFIRPAIARVAMMRALGQHVDDAILNKIESREKFREYFDACMEEMEVIKSSAIIHDVKLSTFLLDELVDEEQLLCYARNVECSARLERFWRRERHSPLHFMKILCTRIENILEITYLRANTASCLREVSGCSYTKVFDGVVKLLDKTSMRNMW